MDLNMFLCTLLGLSGRKTATESDKSGKSDLVDTVEW